MRFHSRYPLLQLWQGGSRDIVQAQTLSVARLEPAIDGGVNGGALLDLFFVNGERVALVPFIRVQPSFLLARGRTPLIWPSAAQGLGFDLLDDIERRVLPWLESLTFARAHNDEAIHAFGDAESLRVFERARAAGFLGAAPYAGVMRALAPYVYAARFCADRSVGIDDPCGAAGAAVLASRSKSVRADLGSTAQNDLAARWYGAPVFGQAGGEYDVVIAHAGSPLQARDVRIALDVSKEEARTIAVASPIPADVLVSFDPEDAPVARTFSVGTNVELPLRSVVNAPMPPAAGGSSGAILLLVREDYERAPDADTDEARGLAERLRAEGFTVALRAPSHIPADYRADLVHAFGLDAVSAGALERFRNAGTPIVATPYLGPAAQDAAWGPAIMAAAHAHASDEAMLAEFLDLVALRKLRTEDGAPFDALSALAHVDAVLVSAPGEEGYVRDSRLFGGEVVRYEPLRAAQPEPVRDIASLAGTAPFVLVHAPVEWRSNLPLLARAAAARGITIVVAGPAADIECLRRATELAPEAVIHLPDAAPEEIEALYRSARVYADVSFAPRGLSRLSRAAASGCRLLVSSASYAVQVWPQAICADPASAESIETSLERAWHADVPAASGGADLFSAAIYAYSKALQARAPA